MKRRSNLVPIPGSADVQRACIGAIRERAKDQRTRELVIVSVEEDVSKATANTMLPPVEVYEEKLTPKFMVEPRQMPIDAAVKQLYLHAFQDQLKQVLNAKSQEQSDRELESMDDEDLDDLMGQAEELYGEFA